MTEEPREKRGEAAWKERREVISRRNAEAHKRARAGQSMRAGVVAEAARAGAEIEADQLRDLNARIANRQARGHW